MAYAKTPEGRAKRLAQEARNRARPERKAVQNAWRDANREHLKAYRAALWADPENRERSRERRYARQYGITIAQYDRMLEDQGRKCLLCKTVYRGKRMLQVHHDHQTGSVVALLCVGHNRYLAHFGDSPAGLRVAADKLEAAEARTALILHVSAGPLEKPEPDDYPDED